MPGAQCVTGTRACRCSAQCWPPGEPGVGLTGLGEMRWPMARSKRAPGSAPHQGWPCCPYQVPLISVMSGMHHAGAFSSQACQERSPRTLPALPHAGSAALRLLAGCLPVPRSSILGAPGTSVCRVVTPCPPSRRGFGVLVLQGARSGDVTGVSADRLALAGPGSARGWALGWLAARPLLLTQVCTHPDLASWPGAS